MTNLKALLISDRKPGHYHLSEGIVAAVARLRPVDVHRLSVRRPLWLTPGLMWRLSTSGLSPALILGYVYGIDATALPAAQLVISAGGDTLAANIAATRLLSATNIFYGSLRRYEPEAFSLVLTSYERNASKPRHVMALKPSALDPDTLPPIPAPNRLPRTAGLLVGGDAGTVHFSPGDWAALLDFVVKTHEDFGTRWVVSNSPRTPAAFSDSLALRKAGDPDGAIAEFIDVRRDGSGTLAKLLAASEALVVTADSSSMVSEGVWARRPVLAVAPADMTLPPNEAAYRRYLEAQGWARSLPIADLAPDAFAEACAALQPLTINPLDQLASLLKEKIPVLSGA